MIKKGIVLLVCCLLFISFLPVSVHAEASTYFVLDSGCTLITYSRTGTSSSVGYIRFDLNPSNASEVRNVILYNENTGFRFYSVSLSQISARFSSGSASSAPDGCEVWGGYNTNNNTLVNGYYVRDNQSYSGNLPYTFSVPVVNVSSTNDKEAAVYYTFGEGAQGPVEPINWGILRDVRYDSAVAGSGFSAFRNVDFIRWNNTIDANNNDISECQVEIQAVPGNWTGTTKEDLLTKGVDAFTIGGAYPPVTLGTVSASVGTFSISWQGVIDQIGWPFDSLYAKLEGTQWLKNGWYYQIRLRGSDGYIGSWQTVYNLTSGSATGSENIINNNEFNSTTNSYLQTITQINNQETVTITYNDTDITIENPYANPEPEGGTNLWDVLKQLVNGLFQLLAKIGQMVGDLLSGLIDLIQNLVTPPDDYTGLQNEININIDDYIRKKQPALHEFNEGLIEIRSEFTTIRNNASEGYCVLRWDPVYLDLRDIGGSRQLLIEGGTHDFGATFNKFITEFGFEYEDYKTLVSAVIYILLIWYTNGKIMRFFH